MLTLASENPSGRSTSRTSATLAGLPPTIRTCHDVPPSNSMPNSSPRVNISTTLNTSKVPDRIAHRRECLMNWKFVRSW
jgi:hypothetical protein